MNIKLRGGNTITEGLIQGIESRGGIFVKINDKGVYFDIPKDSDMNKEDRINLASEAIKGTTGLSFFIKKV